MFGLLKVIVVVAVVAVVGGLATHWVKDKAATTLHHAIDTSLPDKIQAQPWAPLSHGKPVGSARVDFVGGEVTSLHCRTPLGSYTADIDHHFSFRGSSTPIKAGCTGRTLRAALTKATRVSVEAHGKGERMTFTDDHDHVVATLQARV
jgi:hypothetical protein